MFDHLTSPSEELHWHLRSTDKEHLKSPTDIIVILCQEPVRLMCFLEWVDTIPGYRQTSI